MYGRIRAGIKNRILTASLSAVLAAFTILASAASPSPASSQTIKVGAYVVGSSPSALQEYETLVGRKQDYFLYFANWESGYGVELAKEIVARGTTPMLTWEPVGHDLDSINSGSHDAYIRRYGRLLKEVPGTVYLRPMHEMNGNWYSWGAGRSTNTPAKFVSAFRRIVTLMREEGVTNVRFVWSPNHNGLPDWTASSIPSYYPGDSYVDLVAIDGYNFGGSGSSTQWMSFNTIFFGAYSAVARTTSKPIIIGETGSTELGGNKPAWIKDTFTRVKTAYPQITGFIWFQANKETDWRVNSSAASLKAYTDSLAALAVPIGPSAPPAPTITSPTASAVKGTVAVKASIPAPTATQTKAARSVLLVDGVVRGTSYANPPSFAWYTKSFSTGRHTLVVRTIDAAGTYSSSRGVARTVDNAPPKLSLTNPSGGKLYRRYRGLNVKAWTYDYNGIKKVTFSIDGRLRSQDYVPGYSWYWDLRSVRTGWHVIKINSFDRLWNVRTVTKWVYVTY